MVMAQCLFQRIQKRDHTRIDVMAPSWTSALVRCMPECHQWIDSELGHGVLGLKQRFHIAKGLRNQYQRAYILPNSFKSSLIPFWAKIPERIAWRGEWRDPLLTTCIRDKLDHYPLMAQRYVRLVDNQAKQLQKAHFKPALSVDDATRIKALKQFQLTQDIPTLAICPGAAFGPSKQWVFERFIDVAKHFVAKGFRVIVLGSKNDAVIANNIATNVGDKVMPLAGKTNLLDAIALLSTVNAVLTHDSGLMHIACALDRPVVALYGSSSPTFTPPLHPSARIVRHDVGCNPCYKRHCARPSHDCMLAIHSREVIATLGEVMNQ